jgi:DNA polymerase-4
VVAHRETKSVSVEDTYDADLVDRRVLEALVDRQAAKVADRLRSARLSGRTVTVKVRRHDFSTHTRSATLEAPTDSTRVVQRLARRLLGEVDAAGGVRLLGVGVSGLADWVQEALFDGAGLGAGLGAGADGDGDGDGDGADASGSADEPPAQPTAGAARSARPWPPGADVEHAEHGRGWVWGSGAGRVTVRFETAETGPGPVRTFRDDDAALTLWRPPET